MKRLLALHFKFMPFGGHVGFFMAFDALLTEADEVVLAALTKLLPSYRLRLEEEYALFKWVNKSDYTAKIVAAAATQERLLVGLNSSVRSALHASEPAVAAAADHVYYMLRHYGRITRMSYTQQGGCVQMLLEHFASDCAAAATLLGLTPWITQLQTAYAELFSLLEQRDAEQAAKPRYTARTARKHLEDVYHEMMRIISANALANTAPGFAAFITRLNPVIENMNASFRRVRKSLSVGSRTMVKLLEKQRYTGAPVTPLPEVCYLVDGQHVRLSLGKDFALTYYNNIKPGMARVVIHGKGDYRGRFAMTFLIIEAAAHC
jgi:hypothetical protein